VILDRFINKPGIGLLILKRRDQAAVRLALSDVCSKSNSLFAVKHALTQAHRRIATTAKLELWKHIERRRSELSDRTDAVQDIDYGAEYAGSQFTEAQQRKGVASTISVRELTSFSKVAVWPEVLYHLTKVLRPQKVLRDGHLRRNFGELYCAALDFSKQGHLWTIEGVSGGRRIGAGNVSIARVQ
jgi:hypothetical protein